MSILNFLIIVAIFIILLALNSFIRQYIKQNKAENTKLQNSINEILAKLHKLESPESKHIKTETPFVEQEPEKQKESSKFDKILENYEKEQEIEKVKETIKLESKRVEQTPIVEKPIVETTKPKKKYVALPRKSFLEKHPDIEKFIGENLINKIGIVILVLGIGFFVKYAIDQNWINEIARVAIGVLSAGALIALAHKLRKEYKAFSSVLIGGGLALLYFTISLAFHTKGYPLYQEQTVSFIILVFITIFAVFLSIVYNRIEIAILAIIGGFGSPLMISNGSGNYIILFSYMTILNIGMLVLSYFKKWRLVNIVAFGFTILLFGLWISNELISNNFSNFKGAIFFSADFYIVFFLMNIIYNLKYKINFKVLDISLLLINTVAFFTFAMLMLTHINNGVYKGLFSVLLAVFNFIFAFYIHKRQKTDKNLLYLLIGLVFTFITLAIPLQLEGNYITLFWAIESVLLLWLSQKSGFKIMKLGSFAVLVLMLFSLIIDWNKAYDTYAYYNDDYVKALKIILNKIFITSMLVGASLYATFFLLKNEKEKIAWIIPAKIYRFIILGLTVMVFYIGGLLELDYQTFHYFIKYSSNEMAVITYNSLFMITLLLIAHKINIKELSVVISVIVTLFILVFFISLSTTYVDVTDYYINKTEILSNLLLVFRWISIIAVYFVNYLLFRLITKISDKKKDLVFKTGITLFVVTILYLLSADLDTIGVVITNSKDTLVHTQKTGYAILWGISSFVLMIIGMKKKIKTLRILSLGLFAITIIKLFIYDISNISEGGKIIAFILLGVLLLIISFMYQKVKKLVIDDSLTENNRGK